MLAPRELEALRIGYRERVTDTELDHIRDAAAGAARAVRRSRRDARVSAGFDGVELHYAHAYTMASFLSRHQHPQRRLRRRARAPRCGCRSRSSPPCAAKSATTSRSAAASSPTNASTAATGVEDAAYFGVAFARAGMDFLSLSRGGKFDDAKQPAIGEAAYPYTGRAATSACRTTSPTRSGRSAATSSRPRASAAAVRAAGFATPVVVTGGIHGFEQAEALLADGKADIVGFARQASPIPTGSRRCARATAPRCGSASTPTTAKASTRSTSRSPASSGTARRSTSRLRQIARRPPPPDGTGLAQADIALGLTHQLTHVGLAWYRLYWRERPHHPNEAGADLRAAPPHGLAFDGRLIEWDDQREVVRQGLS